MKHRLLLTVLTAAGLTALLATNGSLAQTPDPGQPPAVQPDSESGVDPLTRGPVHEAFAQPEATNPDPSPIVPQRPPDGIDEVPPDQKPEGAHVVWIPGYWAWEDDAGQFVWVSGFWRDVPPDRQWVPGYWIAVDGGYQWVPGYWGSVGAEEVSYLPPPPASLESGPSVPAPDANSVYLPGFWIYRETRYFWRPGFWAPAQPNWVYCPPRYCWTPSGFVFVESYWDYPLDRRGLLFCPVHIDPAVLARRGFYYQPTFAVATPALVTALFVERDFHRFTFGDYFAPEFARRGVVPWFKFRPARNVVSPLFAHFRVQHRSDPGFVPALERLFVERTRGLAPRPPATFVQQNQVIQNLTVNKTVQINNKTVTVNNPQTLVQNLQVVAPLKQVTRINNVRVQPVTKTTLVQHQRVATQIRESAAKRRDVELKLVADGHRPTRPTDPVRTAKLELPRVARPAAAATKAATPPAAPRAPAHVERPLPKHEVVAPKRITPRTETRPLVHTPPGPAPKGTPPPAAKPQPPPPKPAAKPEPKGTPQPAPKTEPKPPPPAAKPAPKAAPPPAAKPQPPAPHPQPAAQHPAPKAAPQPAAQPRPAANPPHPAPQARPAPQPQHPPPAANPKQQHPHPRP
jgi:hypothetical protein